MPVRMQSRNTEAMLVNADQVCARGWQDYLLETRLLLEEAPVGDYLKTCSPSQLECLGLTHGDLATPTRQ